MFKYSSALPILIVAILLVLSGCSTQKSSVTPSLEPELSMPSAETGDSDSNHSLLGCWSVNFDIDSMMATIEPDRIVMPHFNIKSLIPAPIISINSFDPVTQVVDVDVTIINSFMIDGYDVRLIVYTDNIGHMLKNPDNWTALFDIPGGITFNPFKAYAKQTADRIFEGNTQHTENLLVYLPGSNPNVQLAIDASYPANCLEPYEIYDFQHDPLYDELNHTANMSVFVSRWDDQTSVFVEFECPAVMGSTVLELDTMDYEEFTGGIINSEQAPIGDYIGIVKAQTEFSSDYLYDVVTVTVTERPISGWAVRIPEILPTGVEVDSDGNIYSCTYNAYNLWDDSVLRKHSLEGVPLWTRNLGTEESYRNTKDIFVDTTNDFIYIAGSTPCEPWSDEGLMLGKYFPDMQSDWKDKLCMNMDSYGSTVVGDIFKNSYLTARLYDFISTAEGQHMRKYDENGGIVWANDFINDDGFLDFSDAAFHDAINSYQVIGRCLGTVDFDPTTGTYIHEAYGRYDGFLTKWNNAGGLTSVVTWGEAGTGNAYVLPLSVAIDSNYNTFVLGMFTGLVDFDPDRSGILREAYADGYDIFLIKFDPQGHYSASLRLGCEEVFESGNGIAIDEYDNVYITGYFGQTVDFDRSTGTAERTSAGMADIFLAKYTNDLEYIWVQTWGSHMKDKGEDVAIIPGTGDIVLIGTFLSTVDFDPGPGVFELTAMNGGVDSDVFLMKLLPNGFWDPF